MASGLYTYGKEAYDFTGITGDDIKAVLTRSYAPDYANDQYLSDILGAGGELVATSANLSSKTWVNAVFDAQDITYTAVSPGAQCDYIVLYYDTGVSGTSILLVGIDVSAFVVTPSGADIDVQWDVNGIFQL